MIKGRSTYFCLLSLKAGKVLIQQPAKGRQCQYQRYKKRNNMVYVQENCYLQGYNQQ